MAPAVPLPCLCLVTDAQSRGDRSRTGLVAQALAGGVNMVQLREKDLPAAQLLDLALQLRSLTAGRALLFVNDRVDVALACGADGVQLGEQGLPPRAAREAAGGRPLLIGRSVHSVTGAVEAQRDGADLLLVGTVFPSPSHPGAAAGGLVLLERVAEAVTLPFLAIGGIDGDNIGETIAAGASGAAVISAIARSPEPERSARELAEHMQQHWAARATAHVRRAR